MKSIKVYDVEIGFVQNSKVYTKQIKRVGADSEDDASLLAVAIMDESYRGTAAGSDNGVSYVAISITKVDDIYIK